MTTMEKWRSGELVGEAVFEEETAGGEKEMMRSVLLQT